MKRFKNEIVGAFVIAVLVVALVFAPVHTPTRAQNQGSAQLQFNVTTGQFHGFAGGSTSTDMILDIQGGYPNMIVNLPAQGASITTATLCPAATCTAGLYEVSTALSQGGTACSNVTAGGVAVTLAYTDLSGAHAAQAFPLITQGSSTALAASMLFTTTLANSWGSGKFVIWTTGVAAIQYATTFTACTTGTGIYNLNLAVKRIG